MIAPALLILAQTTTPAAPPPDGLNMMVMMLCLFAIMYFLIIRPQNKRQKELAARVSGLKTGDKVVTNGGIHGIVSNVKEGATLILKIADNVKIEVDKSAIASVDKEMAAK